MPIFDLNGNTLHPLETKGNTAILQGSQVTISETAAGLLNSTFKTDAVKAGLLVGIATITVDIRACFLAGADPHGRRPAEVTDS